MQNNQNSNAIFVIVSIFAFLLGIVSYAIYNNFNQAKTIVNDRLGQVLEDTLLNQNYNSNEMGVDNNNSNPIEYTNTNNNSNPVEDTNNSNLLTDEKEEVVDTNPVVDEPKDTNIDNNSNIASNENTENSSSVVGKTSSRQSPLLIGEWGIASKYSDGVYVDVPIKITNVTRGYSAAQTVKDYCDKESTFYRYEEAKTGMEWAVIEYDVDLTNVEEYSMGRSIKVLSDVIGMKEESDSIIYNDYFYIVSTMDMTTGYTKETIGTGQFAVQLPIGCTEYKIVMGSSEGSRAYFMGK